MFQLVPKFSRPALPTSFIILRCMVFLPVFEISTAVELMPQSNKSAVRIVSAGPLYRPFTVCYHRITYISICATDFDKLHSIAEKNEFFVLEYLGAGHCKICSIKEQSFGLKQLFI